MSLSPGSKLNPAWATLPKRNCDNCGTLYKQVRPLRSIDKYGFCKPECKKQFHKHGSSFIQMRDVITKEIARLGRKLEERCKQCKGTAKVNAGKLRGVDCPRCLGGTVLTPFGHEVMSLVIRRLRAHVPGGLGSEGSDVDLYFHDGVNP